MNTWLFQSIPNKFRLANFLSKSPQFCKWRVQKRYENCIHAGDQVFLWQGVGKGAASMSGIYARGIVADEPEVGSDDEDSATYWIESSDPARSECRVLVEIQNCRTSPIITRDLCKDDRILGNMQIFRYSQGSNFRVNKVEEDRVEELWDPRMKIAK